jgi:hypothetical protein
MNGDEMPRRTHGDHVDLPPALLDDDRLTRETSWAFDRWRRAHRPGQRIGDIPRCDRLVELQHEFLHRFPGTDIPSYVTSYPRE